MKHPRHNRLIQRKRRAGICLKGWNNNMPIRGWNYFRAEAMVFRSSAWQEYYDRYLA